MLADQTSTGLSCQVSAADFDTVVRAHRRRMLTYTYWRVGEDWHAAEDVVSDALATAWESRANFTVTDDGREVVEQLTPWMFGILKYRIRRWGARPERRDILASDYAERTGCEFQFTHCPLEPSDLPCMAEPETQERVKAVLATLPAYAREVLLLHCQGLTTEEVAQRRGYTRASVSTALWEAFDRLTNPDKYAPKPTIGMTLGVDSPHAAAVRANPELLDALTPKQREVIRLRYIERVPLTDTADRLGMKVKAVSHQVNTARRRIAELVDLAA
jgi:RNA polymerase sigma factor (sigma-70 family)